MEAKADHLNTELAHTSNGQQSICIIMEKPPKSAHGPPSTKEVQGLSKAVDEAHLQGYGFSFKVCEFIMRAHFPEA